MTTYFTKMLHRGGKKELRVTSYEIRVTGYGLRDTLACRPLDLRFNDS